MWNWPGYWRLCKQAPIEFVHYDIDSNSVKGKYYFPYIYEYSDGYALSDLSNLAPARIDDMYGYLDRFPDLIGVFLVNSYYYMLVYKHKVEIYKDGERLEAMGIDRIIGLEEYEMIPVGFELTLCPTLEYLVVPGRVFMLADGSKIYYKGEFIDNIWGPLEKTTTLSAYHKILHYKNKKGIIYSSSSGHILLE